MNKSFSDALASIKEFQKNLVNEYKDLRSPKRILSFVLINSLIALRKEFDSVKEFKKHVDDQITLSLSEEDKENLGVTSMTNEEAEKHMKDILLAINRKAISDIIKLRGYLSKAIEKYGCDNTLRRTKEIFRTKSLSGKVELSMMIDEIKPACDCELLNKLDETLEERCKRN